MPGAKRPSDDEEDRNEKDGVFAVTVGPLVVAAPAWAAAGECARFAGAASGWPHCRQNWLETGTSDLQAGQVRIGTSHTPSSRDLTPLGGSTALGVGFVSLQEGTHIISDASGLQPSFAEQRRPRGPGARDTPTLSSGLRRRRHVRPSRALGNRAAERRSARRKRILATLSAAFGAVALLLSLVGLVGVMSFVVTQRTREIGIRIALGAHRPAAVWLVLRDAVAMIVAGAAIALPCVAALGRLVESQLFGVTPTDPATIAATTLLLALAALGAAFVPAYGASTVNPTDALRAE